MKPSAQKAEAEEPQKQGWLGLPGKIFSTNCLIVLLGCVPRISEGAEMRPVIVCLLLHGVLLCGTFSGLLPCFLSGFLTFHMALRIHMDTRDFTGFRPESLLVTSFATSHTAWSWKPDCGDVGMKKQ